MVTKLDMGLQLLYSIQQLLFHFYFGLDSVLLSVNRMLWALLSEELL